MRSAGGGSVGGPGGMSVDLSIESSLMYWLALALSGQDDHQSWLGQNVVGLGRAAGGPCVGPSGVVGNCGGCCDGDVGVWLLLPAVNKR